MIKKVRVQVLSQEEQRIGQLLLQGRSYRFIGNRLHCYRWQVKRVTKEVSEAEYQRFFEDNPSFLTSDDHIEARADVYLSRDGASTLKPDFVLKPLDPQPTSDLLELKLPSAQVYVLKSRRERLSQAVMEASAQLLDYARYFDDARNREFIQGTYGLSLGGDPTT